ncbi:bifunctional diaminohydroxyphosphoribosylaminopyrimidine deaminase/5-amino-6-(5-phosphoribosylamino)uracil reductase RibD [bacterium]|nr:bifunctional diaminohydroxyphosphoribosylaminopyrimidine deaminase/5-amino-6-(5-phosphoribosylamino)uracil reductase RibD [bacterium]
MARAIEVAWKGEGCTGTNPLVGAVLVKDDVELSSGAYSRFGGEHAEVKALRGKDAESGTLYTTLEPCVYHGKTPPCTDIILESGLKRVVVGMEDPNPRIKGRGNALLTKRGLEVVVGVCEDEVALLNPAYLLGIKKGRTAVTLKVAVSLDGRIAAADGSSQWITSGEARLDGKALRNRHHALLVGAGTVVADNPLLERSAHPDLPWYRVVIDRQGRIPSTSHIFGARDLLWWGDKSQDVPPSAERIEPEDLSDLLVLLRERGIQSLLVEGGKLGAALLERGLVDRLVAYVAPVLLGSRGLGFSPSTWATLEDGARLRDLSIKKVGVDVRIEGVL